MLENVINRVFYQTVAGLSELMPNMRWRDKGEQMFNVAESKSFHAHRFISKRRQVH